jgi:hypothetical protein
MAIHEKQEFANGVIRIHFLNPIQGDYALCGQDIAGDTIDENGAYDNATQTKEKVTCQQCILIVEYCKSINRNEY